MKEANAMPTTPCVITTGTWGRSYLEQHPGRILELLFDAHEEPHRLLAIDEAVIVRQRDVHHRADDRLAADGDRSLLDLVHAENSRLWRIEQRRGQQRADDAAVGDGE